MKTRRLILCIGMPRAGSGWHYNLIHDLVVAVGGQNAREIRRRYRLGRVLTEVNCNIGALSTHRVALVMWPVIFGNVFAIKTHAEPRLLARQLIRSGHIRATHIYRDPRAALLSAYEYGQRGATGFSHLKTFEQAVDFMLDYVHKWEEWILFDRLLHVRYEDLLSNYDEEIARLSSFLRIDQDAPAVQTIIEQYRPGQVQQDHQGLHFFKGQPERFRSAMTPGQLETCNQAFAPYLEKMGYAL